MSRAQKPRLEVWVELQKLKFNPVVKLANQHEILMKLYGETGNEKLLIEAANIAEKLLSFTSAKPRDNSHLITVQNNPLADLMKEIAIEDKSAEADDSE